MNRRSSILRSILAGALFWPLIPGCAGTGTKPAPDAPQSVEPVASAADPSGRMQGFQLARRYADVVRIDGRSVQQTVEYGFDYDRAVTTRRIYDSQGGLLSDQPQPGESLRANAAEEARLRELVATHPVLGSMMNEPGLLVHSGGFVFRDPDDPYCSRGSRCLRYIVSKGDGSIPHIHAVVDLVSDRVVYPDYEHRSTTASTSKELHP